MLDVMLIREFDVEEINAATVAKAFTEGARAVGLLDKHNTVADIDQLTAQAPPRRELASPTPAANSFRAPATNKEPTRSVANANIEGEEPTLTLNPPPTTRHTPAPGHADAVANLFGLERGALGTPHATPIPIATTTPRPTPEPPTTPRTTYSTATARSLPVPTIVPIPVSNTQFMVRLTGPGIDTQLEITHEDDLLLVQGLLEKIRRQLRA